MPKQLLKGNVAIAEAALRAGLDAYFGYPITPQTEILETLSARLPELGRVFLQAESELGAINMAIGAACTGAKVMTSSSGPGMSLMMEGISYAAGMEVPLVLVDVMRAGPGLANISPGQGDYNQVARGGGHGDYRLFVLAPSTVQEAVDLTMRAFDLAAKYRLLTAILLDGAIGQMMEPAELPQFAEKVSESPNWAVDGTGDRERRKLSSFYLDDAKLEEVNIRLQRRWQEAEEKEVSFADYFIDDAEIVLVAFGIAARVCLSAVRTARKLGMRAGLLRPITLRPFPREVLRRLSEAGTRFLVVEMNAGQMLDDVVVSVSDEKRVEFFGRMGGNIPYPDEILGQIQLLHAAMPLKGATPKERWLNRIGTEIP